MKKLMIIAVLVVVGCAKTVYIPVESMRTVERIVRDTVVEKQIEREYVEHTTPDTTSTLSNTYSATTATWSAGLLYHTLESRDAVIEIPVKYIETNTYDTIRVPYPVKGDDVPIRMSLRWWESFLMVLGIVLIGAWAVKAILKRVRL